MEPLPSDWQGSLSTASSLYVELGAGLQGPVGVGDAHRVTNMAFEGSGWAQGAII